MASRGCADVGLPWGVDPLWRGHFLPGPTSFLGSKPVIAGGCPGPVPPRVVCHASPSNPCWGCARAS